MMHASQKKPFGQHCGEVSVVPSSVKPPHSGCMGVLQKASWEMGGSATWAINSECSLIPCFHCWCSIELCIQALPVFIGCGDCYWRGWQLSARLSERPSCALHCCSASQHYCSWWAFFLKSFPAVSWYGKPLKLAPDCSVYFVLDKRQNTVPAASQEVGGSGGWGSEDTSKVFYKREFPDKTVKRRTCDTVTGPANYMWPWRADQAKTFDVHTPHSRKENWGPSMKSY